MKKWIVGLVLLAAMVVALFCSPPGREAHAQSSVTYHPMSNGWNVASVSSGAAVFGSDLVPVYPVSVIRIAVVLGSTASLSIRETDGTHTFTSYLNGGTALTGGVCYTFVWECRTSAGSSGIPGQPTGINYIVGAPTTVPILRTTELSAAVD